jgi:hypothetical protein
MTHLTSITCAILFILAAGLRAYADPVSNVSPNAPTNEEMPAATAPKPLPYQTERWDEDYSYLRNPAARTDYADPLKYIPLNPNGDSYVTFGGLIRDRYENFNHNDFGSGKQTPGGYDLFRLDLYADVHLTPYFRVFVEGLSADEDGRAGGPRGRDTNSIAAQQAFGEFDVPLEGKNKLDLRVGRQELLFGAERLIGPADFSNVRKTFDGFRGTLVTGDNQLDIFLVRPVRVEKYTSDNADNTTVFGGIYDTLKMPQLLPHGDTKVELYGLYLKRDHTSYTDVTGVGDDHRYTAGARFSSNPRPWDFDVEADYQFGRFLGEDVEAYSLASLLGYTFQNVELTPHPFVGFDIASGDNNPNHGPMGTFNQLFPSAHSYFGYMDYVSRQNIIDLHPGFDLTLLEKAPFAQKLTLRSEYHQFWRQSVHDSLYDTTGAAIRSGLSNDRRNIGSEIDELFKLQIDRHWSSYVGYSHFFHGSFISESGPAKDSDFTYVALTYEF